MAPAAGAKGASWWLRCFGRRDRDAIRVELTRGDTRIVVEWPVQASDACAAWLRTLLV